MSGFYATADHPRRIAILAAIQTKPGICFRELARTTCISHGGTAHHLAILERLGLAHTANYRQRRVAFPGPRADRTPAECMKHRLSGGLRDAYDLVCARPGLTQKQLIDALRAMPKSTAQSRLNQLCAGGLLERTHHGARGFAYRPVHA